MLVSRVQSLFSKHDDIPEEILLLRQRKVSKRSQQYFNNTQSFPCNNKRSNNQPLRLRLMVFTIIMLFVNNGPAAVVVVESRNCGGNNGGSFPPSRQVRQLTDDQANAEVSGQPGAPAAMTNPLNFTPEQLQRLDDFHRHVIRAKILASLNLPTFPPNDNNVNNNNNVNVNSSSTNSNKNPRIPVIWKLNDDKIETDQPTIFFLAAEKTSSSSSSSECQAKFRFNKVENETLMHSFYASNRFDIELDIVSELWTQTFALRLRSDSDESSTVDLKDSSSGEESRFASKVKNGRRTLNITSWIAQNRRSNIPFSLIATYRKDCNEIDMEELEGTVGAKVTIHEEKIESGESGDEKRTRGEDGGGSRQHSKRELRRLDKMVIDCEQQWSSSFLKDTPGDLADNFLPCCRRKVKVEFSDLGWDSWLVAPSSFESYYCLGRCAEYGGFATVNARQGQSLYADMMNLRREANSLELTPCCSPIHFAPLTVTTLTGDDEEMTKTLKDIIVTNCGCM